MLVTTFLVLLVLLLVYWCFCRRPAGLPPGPARLPFIGSPHVYMGDTRNRLKELGKLYGDVSAVYYGETLVIVLNGVQTIKDTLKQMVFTGRPPPFVRDEICQRKGISNSPNWRGLRGRTLKALREFGTGRTLMESRIIERINRFIPELSKSDGQAIDPSTLLNSLTFNVICSVVMRKRLSPNDQSFQEYLAKVIYMHSSAKVFGLLTLFPWLEYIPGDLFEFYKAKRVYESMVSYHEGIWRQHKQTRALQEPRDVMDLFTDEQAALSESGKMEFLERDFIATTYEMVAAGTETTASTLSWGIVFLMRHPEVQRELQAEVDIHLGYNGVPTYSMRLRMTKMEAFILECLRLGAVVPFGLPHTAYEEAFINGYRIPKGATIIANLYGVLYDHEIWGDPEQFRPWRFLADDGKINNDLASKVVSFSAGRRECVGALLARMELFLIACCLIQKFSFFTPDGSDPNKIDGHLGLTYTPQPYQVLVKRRKHD